MENKSAKKWMMTSWPYIWILRLAGASFSMIAMWVGVEGLLFGSPWWWMAVPGFVTVTAFWIFTTEMMARLARLE